MLGYDIWSKLCCPFRCYTAMKFSGKLVLAILWFGDMIELRYSPNRRFKTHSCHQIVKWSNISPTKILMRVFSSGRFSSFRPYLPVVGRTGRSNLRSNVMKLLKIISWLDCLFTVTAWVDRTCSWHFPTMALAGKALNYLLICLLPSRHFQCYDAFQSDGIFCCM